MFVLMLMNMVMNVISAMIMFVFVVMLLFGAAAALCTHSLYTTSLFSTRISSTEVISIAVYFFTASLGFILEISNWSMA